MIRPIIITFLLLLLSLVIKAQDNKKLQSDSTIKVIPFGEGEHTSYLYTIGGKLQTREDVKIRLMRYAPSAAELLKAQNNMTWNYISDGGFLASSVTATILYATHNKNAGATSAIVNGQAGFIYQHHNLTGAYIFTGLATGFLTTAIITLVKAAKHGKKAVKLYNQQYE